MKNKNDRSSSRPSIERDADTAAGDEGLEEHRSASPSDPNTNERMQSSPRQKRGSNVRTDDVRDLSSIDRTTARQRGSESSSESEEQSGQKSGRVFKMGPGRSSQVPDDDSLSKKDLDRKNLGSSREDQSRSGSSSSPDRSSKESSTRSDRLNEDLNRNSRDIDRSKM